MELDPFYINKQNVIDYFILKTLDNFRVKNKLTWKEISFSNSITRDKLLFYPFFIIMASLESERETLAAVFDKIVVSHHGIVEEDLVKYFSNLSVKDIFMFDSVNSGSAKLFIRQSFINELESTEDLKHLYQKQYHKIFGIIDNVILRFHYRFSNSSVGQNYSNFFDISYEQLQIFSKYHSLYEVYHLVLSDKSPIKMEHVVKCKSIFSPDNNLLQISP
jgi:hypothetical protein